MEKILFGYFVQAPLSYQGETTATTKHQTLPKGWPRTSKTSGCGVREKHGYITQGASRIIRPTRTGKDSNIRQY